MLIVIAWSDAWMELDREAPFDVLSAKLMLTEAAAAAEEEEEEEEEDMMERALTNTRTQNINK